MVSLTSHYGTSVSQREDRIQHVLPIDRTEPSDINKSMHLAQHKNAEYANSNGIEWTFHWLYCNWSRIDCQQTVCTCKWMLARLFACDALRKRITPLNVLLNLVKYVFTTNSCTRVIVALHLVPIDWPRPIIRMGFMWPFSQFMRRCARWHFDEFMWRFFRFYDISGGRDLHRTLHMGRGFVVVWRSFQLRAAPYRCHGDRKLWCGRVTVWREKRSRSSCRRRCCYCPRWWWSSLACPLGGI